MTKVDMNSVDYTEIPKIAVSSIFVLQIRNNASLSIWVYSMSKSVRLIFILKVYSL